MVQDPSYIHEFMTYKLMRSVGIPAPRTGYANVTLNGINYGLHLNVETVDKIMLKRWGITSDHIYKGSLPYFPDFNPGAEWQFKVESGNPPDRSDLMAITETNRLTGESWFTQMNKLLDLEKLTLLWATEFYANHWDGYMMNKNNYFINIDDDGKAIMLPWGTDQTWGGSPGYFSFSTLLPTRCMTSPSCTKLYYQALIKVSIASYELNLDVLAEQVGSAIYQAVMNDPWGPRINALNSQTQAIQQHVFRKEELNTLITPWDTTIKMVAVNKLKFNYAPVIYLAPGVKQAKIAALPRQADATTTTIDRVLKPGSNKTTLKITSPDSQFTTDYQIDFYVLTRHESAVDLSFSAGSSSINMNANQNYGALVKKLAKAKVAQLTITRSSSATSAITTKRIDAIKAQLTKAGLKNLSIDVKVGRVSRDRLAISAKYQD
jgi:hypothetical protein